MSPAVGRTLTIIAIAALAFDGAALAAIGFVTGRIVLVAVGVVFFLSSGLIVLYWRWHVRRLQQIASARRVLAEEAREMQRLLGEK